MTAPTAQNIEHIAIGALTPYARNSRTHSPEQIAQVAASIREFGFTNPVLIYAEGGIVAAMWAHPIIARYWGKACHST